jgi:hypothetical protein
LIITISDTCKNQPKRLDFDNTINLSSLIVSLATHRFSGWYVDWGFRCGTSDFCFSFQNEARATVP